MKKKHLKDMVFARILIFDCEDQMKNNNKENSLRIPFPWSLFRQSDLAPLMETETVQLTMMMSMRMTMMRMMIYILWWSVCLSRKIITFSCESPVTTWTTHNHPVQLQVSFDGSRLVFHGSMSVFIDFQGFRLVSLFLDQFLWFFKVPGWFFEVQG